MAIDEETRQSLVEKSRKQPKTRREKAVRKTCKGTTNLTKQLPSCAVLTFQLLSPICIHQGQCDKAIYKILTLCLLAICSVMCFVSCFIDSYKDAAGKVRYGLATFKGLWIIEGAKISAEEAAKYRLKCIDFLYGFMSMFLFVAVTLSDQNVIKCFVDQEPYSKTVKGFLILNALPLAVSAACGAFFVVFPTKRHGIGSPLSKA